MSLQERKLSAIRELESARAEDPTGGAAREDPAQRGDEAAAAADEEDDQEWGRDSEDEPQRKASTVSLKEATSRCCDDPPARPPLLRAPERERERECERHVLAHAHPAFSLLVSCRPLTPRSQWDSLVVDLTRMSVGLTVLRLMCFIAPPAFYFEARAPLPPRRASPLARRKHRGLDAFAHRPSARSPAELNCIFDSRRHLSTPAPDSGALLRVLRL